jgi:hypothetical protein
MREPLPDETRTPRGETPAYRRDVPQPLRPVEPRAGFDLMNSGRDLVHWAPSWAGMFVSIAMLLLLTPVGVAIGLSSGGGAVVWTIITLFVAFFVGGWVVGRTLSYENGLLSAAHGVLCWALALTFLFTFTAILGTLAGTGAAAAAPGTVGGISILPAQVITASWAAFFALLVGAVGCVVGALVGNHGQNAYHSNY